MKRTIEYTTIPDRWCPKCTFTMRPVWLFGRVLRWTCDHCNQPRRAVWPDEGGEDHGE